MKARNRSYMAALALLVALVAMSVVLPVAAQDAGGRLPLVSSEATVQVSPDINTAAARRADGRISVIVRLATTPAVTDFVAAGGRENRMAADSVASSRAAQISAEQSNFAAAARNLGATVTNSFQFLDNAVVVEVAPDQVRALATLPGVIAIGPNRTYQREHTTSMPLIRASDVWNGGFTGGSYTGEGVTIAIIDEGIDYTHAHFGGNENYADSDPTVLGETGMEYFPPTVLPDTGLREMKVIGGYDYVGDDYDAAGSGAQLIAVPDPDPIGCDYSHGTHVAGTAAGYGVDAAGDTFTGNYTDGDALFPDYPLPSVDDFRIGPGAAPEAYLVSLRIFGCSGSVNTDIILMALEDTLTNTYLGEDIDVVNMSLGSAYGGTGPDDFTLTAQQNLSAAGIVVVASAGNNGDFYLASGAPGSADTTISVANIIDSGAVIDGAFTYGATTIAAAKGGMYPPASPDPLTADVVEGLDAANSAGPSTKDGCSAYTNAAAVVGKWVVVDRGTCSFSAKVNIAKLAGATGILIANNSPAAPFGPGQTAGIDDALPTAMISQSDAVALRAAIGLGTVTGTFDGSVTSITGDITLVPDPGTSRGGIMRGSNDLILKPNVSAPGSTITSAGAGTNDGHYTISGTSMASPHIAGGAALLIEAYGEPTDQSGVSLIKQRLMNTATTDLINSVASPAPYHSPQRVGAGLADFVAAVNTQLVAFASDSPQNTSLSFGYPRALVGTTPSITKTITLRNLSGTAMTVNTGYTPRSDWAGAVVSVSPAIVTVPASSTTTVNVTLTLNATQANLNVGGDPLFPTGGKTILHEESGYVTFTPISGPQTAIRVPVYAAPHITSDIWADEEIELSGDVGSSYVYLSGSGFDFGPDANDHLSLASVYTLVAEDGEETELFWDADSSGVEDSDEELADYSYADVEYVGATLVSTSATTNYLYVAVGMHGEWTSPRDLFIEVYIDVNNDDVDDYVWYYGSGVSDAFTVSFAPLAGSGAFTFNDTLNYFAGASLDSMLLKNNVVSIPVVVSNAGFTGGALPNYTGGPIGVDVVTYQRDSDFSFPIDVVEGVYTPDIAFVPTFYRNAYPALDGVPVYFDYDFTGVTPLPKIMTVMHQNQDPESRVQITDLAVITGESFNLLSPANGTYFRDAADVSAATWEALEGATGYTFILTQTSVNTTRASGDQIVVSGTAAADADPLTCDATVCTLDLSGVVLEDGQYSWAVHAGDVPNQIEAANNAFSFTVESNNINLLSNGGFEDCAAGVASGWTGRCQVNALKAYSGSAFFKGAVNTFIKQTSTHPSASSLAMSDELTLGGFFNAKAKANVVAVATIKYVDGTKGKIKVILTATTVGYEEHTSAPYTVTGPVSAVVAKFGSKTGKAPADDVYLTLTGVSGPRVDGILPPPTAPDGFRGNN